MVARKWTDDLLIADARRFETRKQWQVNSSSAYSTARRRSLLDLACAHMAVVRKVKVKEEDLILDAAGYSTRGEWQKKSPSFYTLAQRRGLLEKACEHMSAPRKLWSQTDVLEDAKRFSSRTEWAKSSKSYGIAQRRGMLGKASEHMGPKAFGTDSDAVYIWRAVGWLFNGEQVYKVGKTSARLNDARIKHVSRVAYVAAEVVILAKVHGDASQVETAVLAIGAHPGCVGFSGCTEFRAMTDAQLMQSVALISRAKQETISKRRQATVRNGVSRCAANSPCASPAA